MCENNLPTIEQFGFWRGLSTELAAIQLVDRLTKQMDLRNVPININIALSKEFDTLDLSILLDKMTFYGICGVENLMFRTYLSNVQVSICGVYWFQIRNIIYSKRRAPRFYLETFTFLYMH